ncbi:UbiA prenyltransferase [Mycena sp. CBHHK59/15]|nr:UbiA prenyltransferase [Mycena sp. CBHHK59/15]
MRGEPSGFRSTSGKPVTDVSTQKSGLLSVPTVEEIQACWELCRLHNNIGFWVVWLPTAWSIAMVYNSQPEISGMQAFRRAIMTIDDLLDYDVDALVERTRHRAIPRGAISVERAWMFFSLQVVIGIYAATTFLSPTAFYVSATVYPLYIIYPTCKRWTNLAPIPLGLIADGSVPWSTLAPVYLGACCWTLTYETLYQHQDKADDIKIGLHSPALLFADYTIPFCTLCSTGFLGMVLYGGIQNGQGLTFCIGMAVAGALLFIRLWKTDIDRPEDCKRVFLGTPRVGQIILLGLIIDSVGNRCLAGVPL